MKSESGIILSIPELRLSLRLLGFEQWADLPLLRAEEPPEQRLLNAFLHLLHTERLLPGANGYILAPDFMALICCIGQAERCSRLCVGERIMAFLYEKARTVVVLAPDWGNWEHCRVTLHPETISSEVAAELSEGMADAVLVDATADEDQPEQYHMGQLAFFFGETMEEMK